MKDNLEPKQDTVKIKVDYNKEAPTSNDAMWCRLELDNGTYHYVKVPKVMAMQLCLTQGYEIKIRPEDVPEHTRKEWGEK